MHIRVLLLLPVMGFVPPDLYIKTLIIIANIHFLPFLHEGGAAQIRKIR